MSKEKQSKDPAEQGNEIKIAADLKQDGNNYRKHSDTNKARIKKSIDEAGLGRSVVVDADGVLVAGNGVQSVIDKDTPVKVVETDGTELVVVKRTSCIRTTRAARRWHSLTTPPPTTWNGISKPSQRIGRKMRLASGAWSVRDLMTREITMQKKRFMKSRYNFCHQRNTYWSLWSGRISTKQESISAVALCSRTI